MHSEALCSAQRRLAQPHAPLAQTPPLSAFTWPGADGLTVDDVFTALLGCIVVLDSVDSSPAPEDIPALDQAHTPERDR